MSLSEILGSALSGLNAAQAGLRSASNNIANVNTPGYARERVPLQTGVTAGQVSGVRTLEAVRVADRFLEATVYRRAGDWGQAEAVANSLDRLQAMLGGPGDASGLPARLDAIGAAAVAMTGAAGSEPTLRGFIGAVSQALSSLQTLDGDIAGLRVDAEREFSYTVGTINNLLKRIDALNDSVARQAAGGRASNGAIDQRMSAVEELAGLIRIEVREGEDGRLTIDTAGGATLLDRRLRLLDYPPSEGSAQPLYPAVKLRFVEVDGSLGADTGERLDSPAVGGRLGGLMDLRDRRLPAFAEEIGSLFGGLAESLNAVSNAGSSVPPPARLEGAQTGFAAGDRLGFTGRVVIAALHPDGVLAASLALDLDSLGPGATIQDAVDAINAGLGGSANASFVGGRLTISGSGSLGVAVAQDPANPSDRAGMGFAQLFGLNDLVSGPRTFGPTGFTAADPHGFAPPQTAEFVLRGPDGRVLAQDSLSPMAGGSFGDLVASLNAGPLSTFGSVALDGRGRLAFTPVANLPTASLSVVSDTSSRFGTGRSLSSLLLPSGRETGLEGATVRPDIAASAGRLPLARLNIAATVGTKALGTGDNRGANAFVDQLRAPVDLGRERVAGMEGYASFVLGQAGLDAAGAKDRLDDMAARRSDAVNRRDSYSGVNIDEELASLVTLQNSYSAAARVMTTATQMYDTLIGMVGR
ncbi:flagellar basal body rod C-terminal domain-containing protein [Sphingomonas sp. LHG3406-1]|uniref:flagellar hook-associated protein FlgK n=1 Tax=Sphingomonas sp. LHG3406-1 TaxID=2804617 RepID=UPI002603F4BF|nr:flagellar basal body rod C-terminal domain-containing protein [Sphingomonas sp. LHG3406-1]